MEEKERLIHLLMPQGRIISLHVTGPLRERVQAFYGMSKDKKTAFIEMAAASGLQHVPVKTKSTCYNDERNRRTYTTCARRRR